MFKEMGTDPLKSCIDRVPLPVRVVVIEKDANIFADLLGEITWKKVADPVYVLLTVRSVFVGRV